MPADLSGTWNLLSSDNFDGYMLALEPEEMFCEGQVCKQTFQRA
ncbi:retinoid-binding protein 7 [Prionailurus iriomotensis]